jgi:hypothetical protein
MFKNKYHLSFDDLLHIQRHYTVRKGDNEMLMPNAKFYLKISSFEYEASGIGGVLATLCWLFAVEILLAEFVFKLLFN